MTSLEPSSHPLAEAMAGVFADLVEQGAVDIVTGDRDDAWEVQADQWTLAAEGWPLAAAFLAIDDEPAEDHEMSLALHAALGPGDLAAMRCLDRNLDGALERSLRRSRDALSFVLAGYLAGDDNDGEQKPI